MRGVDGVIKVVAMQSPIMCCLAMLIATPILLLFILLREPNLKGRVYGP